jgi:hypothetical protein
MDYKIQNAKFIRRGQRKGQDYAEIEVELAGFNSPVTAILEENQGQFSLHQVLQNDADYTIDWYDNDLHQAYFDVRDQLFKSQDNTNTNAQTEFVHQLLEYGDLKNEMNRTM